jgi:vacuolar-type H+-ATPase subunit I/STV1
MFWPAPMILATVWISSEDAEEVLRALGKAKMAHLLESDAEPLIESDKAVWRCSDIYERIQESKYLLEVCGIGRQKNLETPSFAHSMEGLPLKERLDYIEESLASIEEELGCKKDETSELINKEAFLYSNKDIIMEAEKQNIKPKWINSSDKVYELIGLAEPGHMKKLQKILKETTKGEYIIVKGEKTRGYGEKILVAIVSPKEHQGAIEKNIGIIKRINLARKPTSPANLYFLEETILKEQEFAMDYKKTFGLCSTEEGEKGCCFQAWVPRKELPRFRKIVSESTIKKSTLKTRAPEENDEVPILLDNPFFLKPFEAVVGMFSLPQYDEIDPTPMVAVSIMLFFGLMFGDVGHGILLLLAGLAYLHFREEKEKKLGPIIISCSLASIATGFVYGTMFGFEGIIEPFAGKLSFDFNTMLLIASLGLVHMSVGIILSIINRFKVNEDQIDKISALINTVSQLMLLAGVFTMAFGYYINASMDIIIPIAAITFILPTILIPLSGTLPTISRGEIKRIPDEFLLGISELFHILISTLANTISYLRILILAVIHEISSSMLVGGGSVVAESQFGIIVAAPLFILGTMIIMIEGGIVFIQCMRLQYYEFFSKFYAGGGMNFEPYNLPD